MYTIPAPVTEGSVLDLNYDPDIIDETGTFYVDNFEYGFNGCDPGWYWKQRIDNAEGYVACDNEGKFGAYNYYRRDHLGNNREVWNATTNTTVQRTHYYPSGLPWNTATGIGADVQNKKYNGKEWVEMHGYDTYDIVWRQYYPAIARFQTPDPEVEQFYDLSPYSMCGNNMVMNVDPDGRIFNLAAAGIGVSVGVLVGGIVEIGNQLVESGSVTSWKTVGGASLQGGITGGVAGLTGGASLIATAAVAGGANAVGGALNRTIQGQSTTLADVVIDGTVGAVLGAGGKLVGNAVSSGTNNLSNTAKGKLGEAVSEIKYGAQGYKSAGKANVLTGGNTPTGRPAVAKYDHAMTNKITGKQITVESKFNGSTLTPNQAAAQSRVTTPGGLIIDRTTSQGLGNVAKAATVGAGSGVDAQRNKRP